MIVFCSNPEIGDSLCAIPVVQRLAGQCDILYIAMRNGLVAEAAAWPSNVRPLWEAPSGLLRFVRLDIHRTAVAYDPLTPRHAIHLLMELAGLKPPDCIPEIPIRDWNEVVPAHDFLLAPFTADPIGVRCWTDDGWERLIQQLRAVAPLAKIGIVGGSQDPKPWSGVTYEYGHPLAAVAKMMRRTQFAVITLDSGPSHLAHAAGITNHILLANDTLPLERVKQSRSFVVYGRQRWDPQTIAQIALRVPFHDRALPESAFEAATHYSLSHNANNHEIVRMRRDWTWPT